MRLKTKKRIIYIIGFLLLFITEIFIALYVHDNFIRPYFGDVLVVMLIYCFIRIFVPNKIKLLPLYIFVLAVTIEIMQYFNVVHLLGLENYKLARIVLGTSFSIVDIFCYLAGCLLLTIWEVKNNAKL